jgi:hypothetical protein
LIRASFLVVPDGESDTIFIVEAMKLSIEPILIELLFELDYLARLVGPDCNDRVLPKVLSIEDEVIGAGGGTPLTLPVKLPVDVRAAELNYFGGVLVFHYDTIIQHLN